MNGCTIQGCPVPEELIGELIDSSNLPDKDLGPQLQRDGYLFIRGAFDASVALKAREEVFARLMEVGEIDAPPIDGIFTGNSSRKEMYADLGQFWQSVSEGASLRQATHGAQIQSVLNRVFQETARAQDYVFLRPSPVGRSTHLHYDRPFFARGSERTVTVWSALGSIPVSEGPLMVVEGSNRYDDLIENIKQMDYNSKDSPKVQYTDDAISFVRDRETRILTASFDPGDVIIFGMTILHGTLDNTSPIGRARLSTDVRWQPAADPMDERYMGPNPAGTTGIGYGELNGAKPLTEPWHIR